MSTIHSTPTQAGSAPANVNIATRLSEVARRAPRQIATVQPVRQLGGGYRYLTRTFAELEDESNRIASGLLQMGVAAGERLALLVPYSHEFVALTFALFKAGVVSVLIDPGMGRRQMVRCLAEADPDGFVAIPLAQAVRQLVRQRFPKTRHLVTVGRRWFWGGCTLNQLRRSSLEGFAPVATSADDPAAIIFTTGSTGPAKGVLYRHGNFDCQVREIVRRYQIEPGGVDLACFPLFALFNGGMGTTTVIPDMDPTRPAQADPRKLIQIMSDWKVTQSFASPAVWNRVGRYCERQRIQLPRTVQHFYSAGAPVAPHVIRRLLGSADPQARLQTPYGATEALPVSSIGSQEILQETASASAEGRGICVGNRFPGIEWRVIAIDDGPLATYDQVDEMPVGQIGELMVRGAVVTSEYVTSPEANALHKVSDGDRLWHRMGDVGYLDDQDRFWFCGRKSHRVVSADRTSYTIPTEAIFNQHPDIHRSALVGVGVPGRQLAVMVCEPWPERWPRSRGHQDQLRRQLAELAAASPLTQEIPLSQILLRRSLPVDIRHNAKIFREKLRPWCAAQLTRSRQAT